MRVINFSEARNHLKSVIDQAVNDADYTMMETVYLLKSPANAQHLADSIKQYRSGKTRQHDLIDA